MKICVEGWALASKVGSVLKIQHLQRRDRRLFALVAKLPAGAFERLLFVQRGEHAKDYRLPGF